MKKIIVIFSCLFATVLVLWLSGFTVSAEQSGSSPESGTDARIKTAYDWLVAKGTNYGSSDATDWTNDWGTMWNRIMEAAAWEPDGTATAGDIPSEYTFYAGNGDRTQITGTLFQPHALMSYTDLSCANNNYENDTACAGGDSEYTGEEGSWTLTASGGTATSVTDNGATVTLTSNKVYQDNWTKLYWSDVNTGGDSVDNEFVYVDGDDRINPTGNSCNFNSTGTANQWCDNQDPLNAYTEDNDVSAAEFCLNLELDADNADNDNNGLTGTETDWRLPTQKEIMQAYINGSTNNLPITNRWVWSSTERSSNQSVAWSMEFNIRTPSDQIKATNRSVVCVRRD